MLSEQELQLFNSLPRDRLDAFLNGHDTSSIEGWNRSEQDWKDFTAAARAHIRWNLLDSQVDIPCMDDVYYFTEDLSDVKARAKELAVEAAQSQVKQKVSSGFNYLFMELEANVQDPYRLKELKTFLLEARPSKSKWASDDKVGQEPLYEALEKVLGELKGYTDHSLPFLKPVQRREAPNYFDIIKNPMDLGTMAKKLKGFEYKSKQEFVKDLNLIWDNCLTYNTVPESIYRKHANRMREKADQLIKLVPDITVKTSAEDSDDDDVSKVLVNGDSNQDQGNTRRPLTFSALEEDPESMDIDMNEEDTPRIDGQKDDDTHHSDQADEDEDEQVAPEELWESVEFKKWKEISLEQRAKIYKRHYIDSGVPFENKTAFVRTPEDMMEYCEQESQCIKRLKARQEDQIMSPEYWEKAFLPELMNPTSVLPHLKQHGCNIGNNSSISLSNVASASLDKSSAIFIKVSQNISDLNYIKKLHYSLEGEKFDTVSTPTGSSTKPTIAAASLTKSEAAKILGQSICLLMVHAGFDAIYESALCTLTDIVSEYMSNFGRTIRKCLDASPSLLSAEEIVKYSLKQNGIDDIKVLHSYISQLVSQGKRLSSIKNFLLEKQRRALHTRNITDGISQEEESELMMSGNYLSVLGIDILNVKEAGIDMTEVSLKLWNDKSSSKISGVEDRLASPLTSNSRIIDISSWEPITPETQIGLMKEFYSRPPDQLVEDDQKPNVKTLKSKVMVRAATMRKRLVIGSETASKKKKKSIKPDL